MDVPWIMVIGSLVGALFGGVVVAFAQRRRARRLADRGRLECSLRVISGDIEGLTDKLHHGSADLERAVVLLRRGLPGGRGTRPGSDPVSLLVDAVEGERRPGVREWWGVAPDCVVLSIRSEGANVEWAILAPQVAWARSRIGV